MCVYGRCEASTVLVIYLLAFRPLLSKAVNRLPQINKNKLKFLPLWVFVSPTLTMTHLASCLTLTGRCYTYGKSAALVDSITFLWRQNLSDVAMSIPLSYPGW